MLSFRSQQVTYRAQQASSSSLTTLPENRLLAGHLVPPFLFYVKELGEGRINNPVPSTLKKSI